MNRPVEGWYWRSGVADWALPEHLLCWLKGVPHTSPGLTGCRAVTAQCCGTALRHSQQPWYGHPQGQWKLMGMRFRIQAAEWILTVCAPAPGCVLLSLPAPIFFHWPVWLSASCGLMSCRGLCEQVKVTAAQMCDRRDTGRTAGAWSHSSNLQVY